MLTNLMKLIRPAVASLLLGVWFVPAAEARQTGATTRTSEPRTTAPRHDAETGLMWIAAVVALFVFLAWLAVRMSGDSGRPSDRVPS